MTPLDWQYKPESGCASPSSVLVITAGFDSQSWYKHLFEYGLSQDASTSGSGSDPDEELVPRLVTQLVLPLAEHSLQYAWNPYSRRSTAAAKAMLEDLLIYVPPEEPKLQVCCRLLQTSLLACITRPAGHNAEVL